MYKGSILERNRQNLRSFGLEKAWHEIGGKPFLELIMMTKISLLM